MKKYLIFFLFLITLPSISAELIVKGNYKGKDVFIRNPFNPSTQAFCTQKVYVNDRLLFENPQLSALRVELGYLEIGDLVVIRVVYSDGCKPAIVNPQVLQGKAGFSFLSTQSDNNSIFWVTEGEVTPGMFVIEQFIKTKKSAEWQVLDSIKGKAEIHRNQYAVSPNHYPGENKYRIIYKPEKGPLVSSVEIKYTSTKSPVTFSPKSATSQITLSEKANYSITDSRDRVVKKGNGTVIFVEDLRPGEYFLHIQNRVEKFVKK